MMEYYSDKKSEQVGMSISKAAHRLKKLIMFDLVKKLSQNKCYRCREAIDKVEEFSIDHIIPYLDSENPKELFFDLDNIAFSHLSCNFKAARKSLERRSKLKPLKEGKVKRGIKNHGSAGLRRGCRCLVCKTYERESYLRAYKKRKEKRLQIQ